MEKVKTNWWLKNPMAIQHVLFVSNCLLYIRCICVLIFFINIGRAMTLFGKLSVEFMVSTHVYF